MNRATEMIRTTGTTLILRTLRDCRHAVVGFTFSLLTGVTLAAPTVSLSAPAANAQYLAPATVTLSATATPSSGTTIAKVEFYQGTTLVGTDTSSPYSISWASVPAGTYSLTAKATDSAGGVTTSAARSIAITATNTPPSVSLSAPANAVQYFAPASLTVSASASGVETNTPISNVEFYANGSLIGSDTTSPYSIAWANPPAGTYSLTAIATDSAGGVTTSAARTVTVNAANTAPTVSLSAPANNAKYLAPATVTVTASASGVEANTPIIKVEFLDGSTVIATLTASPYSYAWSNPAAGTHSLTARATDSGGAVTTSAARSITIAATNTLPTVSLSAPANNATVQAPVDVLISASVSAPEVNDTLTKVEFFQGTTLIGTATASPWQVIWVKPAAGVYNLTAKATDGQGGTTTSAVRKLTVTATPVAKLYFLHTDQINTPRLVTDEANKVVWRNSPISEPFGMSPVEEDPDGDGKPFTMNLRFPGQYADKESNTNYNYFRDYDPNIGRYLQSDPIGNVFYQNMAEQNLSINVLVKPELNEQLYSQVPAYNQSYAYAEANSLSNADPLGLADRMQCEAIQIIQTECKGSVMRVFPGQYLNSTLCEIKIAAQSGDSPARTAWKLLNDNRFKK